MKKKSHSRSGFFNSRGIIALLVWVTVACSLMTGTLLPFLHAERPATISQRKLTFEEQVAYQRDIEDANEGFTFTPGSAGAQYLIRFSIEEWAPFVTLNSIFNEGQSINSGFAVDVWRPNHFENGTDVLTNRPVNNLFTGINADLAVRDTDAWLYRPGYNITLLGKIVFVAPVFE